MGTIRLYEESPGIGRLGRMAVLPQGRKQGLGKKLIQKMEEYAKSMGLKEIQCHAQMAVKQFYAACGYQQMSDEIFEEEGILHVYMSKIL